MSELVQNQVSLAQELHEASGNHFLLKLDGCDAAELNDEAKLVVLARRAALATGATVLDVISRRFEPQGITVLVMLAESHASMHTYPEWGVLFWDCFTCGQSCRPDLSAAPLIESLHPLSVHKQVVVRS